jgi:DnaJ homolog subfamily A member 2
MITSQLHECNNCAGAGEVFREKDKCRKCHGARTATTKKFLELYIPPGSRSGEKIVLSGEADQDPDDLSPGDLVFIVKEQDHETFQRRGNDLCAETQVTLAEALTGLDRVVLKHLDGRGISIKISQQRGKVLRPGEVLKITGEGMPIKRTDSRGDLYLVIKVEFPEDGWISDRKAIDSIQKALPGPRPPIEAEIVDEREFETSTLDEFVDGDASEWEDDEDDERPPQCATQ